MHLKAPTEGIISLVMLAMRLLSTECRRALLIRRMHFNCRKSAFEGADRGYFITCYVDKEVTLY